MRGSGIVTTRLESCLVVTFGEEAPEPTLEEVSRVTLEALHARRASAVLFDLTALVILDREEFRRLRAIGEMTQVLGAAPMFVGLRPGLVQYLVESDAPTEGLRAAPTLERALAMVRDAEVAS